LANPCSRTGPPSPTARHREPGPEPAKPFSLPADDGLRLNIGQRPTPARPQAAEGNPEHPIESRQNGAPPFSLERRELESQGSVFESHGLVTAHQESDESEDRQNQVKSHVPRLFADIPFHVNFLQADGIMANYRIARCRPAASRPFFIH
jgi:hypothetical protein